VKALFRIGLSVYLMFATLAGPWLCCCRLPHLSARFAALLRKDEAKPAESSHSCCQHRAPVKDSRPAHHPDAPSCPCQGTRQQEPALVLLESDGTRLLDRNSNAQAVDLLGCDCLSGVVMPSVGLMLTSSSLSSSVLSGRDILSSLHILRC
jgi:hypothetical protein